MISLLNNLPHKCTIQLRTRQRTGDLGGSKDTATVEQTNVPCWEQQAGASEIKDYEKRGQRVNRKVYFNADPGVTEQHEIIITERNGVPVVVQLKMKVVTEVDPDANVGFQNLFRVMVEKTTTVND